MCLCNAGPGARPLRSSQLAALFGWRRESAAKRRKKKNKGKPKKPRKKLTEDEKLARRMKKMGARPSKKELRRH